MKSLSIKAYAKINLFLKVHEKRADGYHGVSTALTNVDLADELKFSSSSQLTLASNTQILEQENLIMKAAKLLQAESKASYGAAITLKKNIPIEAGLGGGSSDAAATIVALNKLWGLNWPDEKLSEIGARLGSDVNFFLHGGLALAEGRGEKILPISEFLELVLVIAKPDFGIKASEAYSYWDELTDNKETDTSELMAAAKESKLSTDTLFNDLEAPVLTHYPKLKRLFEVGLAAGAKKVMLSGSGSAFFAIVDKETQNNVYSAFKQEGLALYRAKTINRSFDIDES
ncbi:hypothetical protein LCGC14_0934690 [marine sediment metagenome]|uniref:4-(cytidine 5'-diphospho)-2-C-methyl-D-erythritol kinase n=1 Tax=marine sediment metagenome TaxID=412755 RepID=A0A0F9RTG0_9ZZZZ